MLVDKIHTVSLVESPSFGKKKENTQRPALPVEEMKGDELAMN